MDSELQKVIDRRMGNHLSLMADLAGAIDGLDPKDKTTWPQSWLDEITVIDAARKYANLRTVVDNQAKDEGLWFVASTAPEAYLQQGLRRLHAAIEGGS